jgi:hypothetical protein
MADSAKDFGEVVQQPAQRRSPYATTIAAAALISLAVGTRHFVPGSPNIEYPGDYMVDWYYGWPFAFHKTIDSDRILSPSEFIQYGWHGAVLLNIAVLSVILSCTVFTCEYWRRCLRAGPMQFRIRTLFLMTTSVAILLGLMEHQVIGWRSLLLIPISFGVACCPFSAGIMLEHVSRKQDRQTRLLRSKFRK